MVNAGTTTTAPGPHCLCAEWGEGRWRTGGLVFSRGTAGVLLASYLVKATDGRGDYFLADKGWLYIVILSVGYMVSRGLAKSGSRHRDDA